MSEEIEEKVLYYIIYIMIVYLQETSARSKFAMESILPDVTVPYSMGRGDRTIRVWWKIITVNQIGIKNDLIIRIPGLSP